MSNIKTFVHANPEISKLNHHWDGESQITFVKDNDNGFDITVESDGNHITLLTDNGYHDHIEIDLFESEDEALLLIFGLVRDLLSKNMRIRVLMRNGNPTKWVLEYYKNKKWHQESAMGLLIFNIFGKKSEKIFYNDILPVRTFKDK